MDHTRAHSCTQNDRIENSQKSSKKNTFARDGNISEHGFPFPCETKHKEPPIDPRHVTRPKIGSHQRYYTTDRNMQEQQTFQRTYRGFGILSRSSLRTSPCKSRPMHEAVDEEPDENPKSTMLRTRSRKYTQASVLSFGA